ncbi:ROK family transcriptional regulator [Cryobacterium sp. SO1]|uniref:ROK family transcriptional regulator n=1 Tax=Cryobacterium sp. SO1 TaxID=1897061 RepID=UPI0010CE3B99|nr:ROK family transcriptional regulator [Cryobacterium sp. SO1]RZI34709.1 N-acetylglucosamine repressor [Cryobacterium sp. SO1]
MSWVSTILAGILADNEGIGAPICEENMRRGSNLHALGGFNQTVVLDTIRRTPAGLSRVEIAEQTGLSAQTVSNVSRRLLDAGVIREAGIRNLGVGKPRTILQLDPSGHYAIGVHIDPAVITYVLLNIEGHVLAHATTRTPSAADPGVVITEMRDSVEAIIASAGIERQRVLGVGIASPGPIDMNLGVVLDPPLLSNWHGVALRDELERATGFFVLLEKDVTAAAVGELWKSTGADYDDFLFFYYGTGVGVGLVLGREVVRGPTKNAGDAGHIVVDPAGPQCRCGRRGCLGDAISPVTIVNSAVERGLIQVPGETPHTSAIDAGFSQVAVLAHAGNPAAIELLDEVARYMAEAIVTIVNLLDLNRVVFGGPYWERVADLLLDRVPAVINGSTALVTLRPVTVTGSTIGADVAAVGAACLVLDATLSPRSATLFISS